MRLDKKTIILTEKVHRDYRLPLKRFYGGRISENHEEGTNKIFPRQFFNVTGEENQRVHEM